MIVIPHGWRPKLRMCVVSILAEVAAERGAYPRTTEALDACGTRSPRSTLDARDVRRGRRGARGTQCGVQSCENRHRQQWGRLMLQVEELH